MIRFEDVAIGPFEGLTFKVEAGAVCKIVTAAEYEKEVLIQALAGQLQPEKGAFSCSRRTSGRYRRRKPWSFFSGWG